MYLSRSRMTLISALVSRRTNASAGTPAVEAASLRIVNSTRIEFAASLPPLNATALPDLRHRDMICGTTSGRDSNIIPSIPMGQRIWYRVRPSSRSSADICSPTGSARPMTSLMPAIIPSILDPSIFSLLYIDPDISPLSSIAFAASRSLVLASNICSRDASSACAMAPSALSLTSVDNTDSSIEAALALLISETTSDIVPTRNRRCQ